MKNEYDIKNILTKAEERDLIKKAQMGNQAAITELIFKNHGLILKLANRYLRESLKLDDLINEGRLGVYQAILNFDLETNYKFSTYAFWWIRCYISEFVRLECRNIVIPSVKYAELSNLKKIRSELAQSLTTFNFRK